MSDDLSKRGGQDRTRINVNQDYELRDWAKKFGITRDELKEEVRAAGSDRAPDVESPSRTRAATHSAKASQRNAARAVARPGSAGDHLSFFGFSRFKFLTDPAFANAGVAASVRIAGAK
jgi:hypothetical protein